MNPSALKNLTLASAKHLVTQGHITKAHHAKILKGAGIKPMASMGAAPGSTGMQMADEVPAGPTAFGSLNPSPKTIRGAGAGHYMGSMPAEGMGGGGGGI